MSSKSLATISSSRRKATTLRRLWTLSVRARVTSFSAMGRSALALASVVTMASAAKRDAARLAIIAFWWEAEPPKRRLLRGVGIGGSSVGLGDDGGRATLEGQAPLVQLGDDLVEGLLAEVGDGQQVVLALLEQLAHGVDLGPLEAVAGALGEVEVLDGQVQVRRTGGLGAGLGELEALGLVGDLLDQRDEGPQGAAGGGQGLAG